jgi:hypothetical protein
MSLLHSSTRHLIFLIAAVLVMPGLASAQENIGAGRTEIVTAVFGGGAVFMPAATSGTSMTNNVLVGISVTRNVSPRLGFEGDVTVALGRRDAHALYGLVSTNQKAPNLLFYGANLVFSPFRSDRRMVPFVEAGIGGLRVFDAQPGLATGLLPNSSHLTANAGGGVRWFVVPHYGVRAGYQYVFIGNGKDDPRLAGQLAVQHAHRVCGALIITF